MKHDALLLLAQFVIFVFIHFLFLQCLSSLWINHQRARIVLLINISIVSGSVQHMANDK